MNQACQNSIIGKNLTDFICFDLYYFRFALIVEKRTAIAAVLFDVIAFRAFKQFQDDFHKTIFDNYIPMLTYFISDDMITTEVVYNYEEETFL